MKIIRNKKNFILGILFIILSLYSLIPKICFKSLDLDDVYIIVLYVLIGIMQFITSISPCFLGEKAVDNHEDERDVYIALKSSSLASRIMFYCTGLAIFVFYILHSIYKNTTFAIISVSLCSCLLLYSVVYLFVNIFYEKKG